jgi:hypothetical protein
MSLDTVTKIETRILEWLGHVIITEDTRTPKTILNTKPEGRRGVRRPKLRWLDEPETAIKTLIKTLRVKGTD